MLVARIPEGAEEEGGRAGVGPGLLIGTAPVGVAASKLDLGTGTRLSVAGGVSAAGGASAGVVSAGGVATDGVVFAGGAGAASAGGVGIAHAVGAVGTYKAVEAGLAGLAAGV